MVTLVTAQRDLPHAQEFFEAVAALDPHIVTVAQNINGRPGNAILGEETRIVYGAECMRDQLLGCEFDISPTAFYQTNPQQTELLYRLAIDGMDLQQGDILMDAYCGSGTIGLCAVKDAQDKGIGIMLLGVERNPAGIATHVAMPSSTASPAALGLWPTTPPITSWTPPTTTSGSMSFPSTRRAPAPPPSSSKPPAHSSRAASPISAATL